MSHLKLLRGNFDIKLFFKCAVSSYTCFFTIKILLLSSMVIIGLINYNFALPIILIILYPGYGLFKLVQILTYDYQPLLKLKKKNILFFSSLIYYVHWTKFNKKKLLYTNKEQKK